MFLLHTLLNMPPPTFSGVAELLLRWLCQISQGTDVVCNTYITYKYRGGWADQTGVRRNHVCCDGSGHKSSLKIGKQLFSRVSSNQDSFISLQVNGWMADISVFWRLYNGHVSGQRVLHVQRRQRESIKRSHRCTKLQTQRNRHSTRVWTRPDYASITDINSECEKQWHRCTSVAAVLCRCGKQLPKRTGVGLSCNSTKPYISIGLIGFHYPASCSWISCV